MYILEVTGYNFKNILFFSLKIDFCLANTADHGEMTHYVTFHLGLQCLPKYLLWGLRSTRG